MRFILATLAILFFACIAFSQTPKPVEVHALPCKLAELKATGKEILWRVPQGVESRALDGGTTLLVVAPAGRYPILAATINEDGKLALFDFVLIVEGPEPLPPPKPNDPLKDELRALFMADVGTDKPANLVKLTAVFTQAAALAKLDSVQTAMQLADAVRAVSKSMLPADALLGIRKRIGEVITASLAEVDPDAILDPATRAKAAELYSRIASALAAIEGAK
jgi:hypothetical protein